MRQRLADHLLDVLQQRRSRPARPARLRARPARTRGAADAVNVVFGHVRQLVVHDVRQLFDIEPARRDFRRDQRHDLVRLEVRQRAHARALALVAVNRRGRNAACLELLR